MIRSQLPLILLLSACQTAPGSGAEPRPAEAVITQGEIEADGDGRCFARTAAPTETVVVEELAEVVPEVRDQNGVITSPAVFRTVTRPQTRATGPGRRFETVCPHLLTSELVLTLQRALIVRRVYAGPVNGTYDEPTRAAVRSVQITEGIDSPLLSVDLARTLGIIAIPRDSR